MGYLHLKPQPSTSLILQLEATAQQSHPLADAQQAKMATAGQLPKAVWDSKAAAVIANA